MKKKCDKVLRAWHTLLRILPLHFYIIQGNGSVTFIAVILKRLPDKKTRNGKLETKNYVSIIWSRFDT